MAENSSSLLDSRNRGTMPPMNEPSHTRAGGDRGEDPRKAFGFPRVETAGAPAFGVEGDDVAPPEWIQLVPAGSFHGRDGRGPYLLSDPEAVIAATNALRMRAGIPIDYDLPPTSARRREIPRRRRDGSRNSRFAAAPYGAASNGPSAPPSRFVRMSIATSRRFSSTRPATERSRGFCAPA
jgi:hypothetical protein